jgi:hypothetical protein
VHRPILAQDLELRLGSNGQSGPMAQASRCAVTTLGTDVTTDAGNGDKVGRSDGGEHHWGRASPPGKAVSGRTQRGDAMVWRRRRSFGLAVFVGNARHTMFGGGFGVS